MFRHWGIGVRKVAFNEHWAQTAAALLQGGEHDGTGGSVGMKAEALEADLCECGMQVMRRKNWTD